MAIIPSRSRHKKWAKYRNNRDLKIYDGDVVENVTSKYDFVAVYVFRDYSVSFTSYNVGEVP